MGLFTKLFGTRSEREVKKLEPQVEAVMALEEPYKKLTDQQLRKKTQEFKDRLATGETLDDLLPEAFAVCLRGSRSRTRHAAVPRAGRGRHRAAPGTHRRDEDPAKARPSSPSSRPISTH